MSKVYNIKQGTDAELHDLTITGTLVRNGSTVNAALLLGTGEAVDLNGEADALVLDADADTTISAPTDDQIDIEINGADDFRFTANTFTALSGSSIATDTIVEVTSAAGVTADGVLLKDGAVNAKRPIVAINSNTSITAAQTGTLFVLSATTGTDGAIITLPSTAAGLEYEFFILTLPGTSVPHALSPAAADKFIGLGLSGVDNKDLQHPVASDAIGDWVRIVGDGADGWYIIGARGTFAIESP